LVVRLRWNRSHRIIAARLPRIDVFERIADPADLPAVLELEALTNPRLREAAGAIASVPEHDRVVGPGASFVMASFAYPRPGRFSDGSFGAYNAARELKTAIAETAYHRGVFLRDTNEPPGIFEHRVIEANIRGSFLDAASDPDAEALLSPADYNASQEFARRAHADDADGIVWPSVRAAGGHCVAVFRPRLVSGAHTSAYLGYRWNGESVYDVFTLTSLTTTYPA
jgi:RES domain-containing protein